MNTDISRVLARKQWEKKKLERDAGGMSGSDWVLTLILNCLHDKYGFGRKRFAAMNEAWNHNLEKEKRDKFITIWLQDLENYGFDKRLHERAADKMSRMILGHHRDRGVKQHTMDMLLGTAVVVFHTLLTDYGFRKKRIVDLQNYYKDKAYVLIHGQVKIWEFMKCLNVECAIAYPALEEYERRFGPVDIYGGNRGKIGK